MPEIINAKRICPECGERFVATHGRQRFCQVPHKTAFHARNRDRGKMIVPLIQAWRVGRNKKGGSHDSRFAFAEMCALTDLWNEEDRKAGRRPDIAVRDRRLSGWSGVDSLASPTGSKFTF